MRKSQKRLFLIISTSLLVLLPTLRGQDEAKVFKLFFDEALSSEVAYKNLKDLCQQFPGRLTGSKAAAGAVKFTRQLMDRMGLDRVWLQEVWVKTWQPGKAAVAAISSDKLGKKELDVCAIGGSIATGESGVAGKVVEVRNFKELQNLGSKIISGKIVFYNQKMDPTLINTFAAYSRAASQRTQGAIEAAKHGAIGTIVRSLTLTIDDFPHTGIMFYQQGIKAIPAIAVSTRGAELLSLWLKKNPQLKLRFSTFCRLLPDTKSHNVIGEIKGSRFPDQIITVGGHLDSWFNGEGAHDDGGGCMQSIEVLRLFKVLNIKPLHTIRAVMFMDEEVSQRGGQTYAIRAKESREKHIVAIESDRGVLVPRALGISAPEEIFKKLSLYKKYFIPYGIHIVKGGGGVDIGPLKDKYKDITLVSLITDSQRYFDFHHSANDTFLKVNRREMQMGSAAMACLIYLIDNLF